MFRCREIGEEYYTPKGYINKLSGDPVESDDEEDDNQAVIEKIDKIEI